MAKTNRNTTHTPVVRAPRKKPSKYPEGAVHSPTIMPLSNQYTSPRRGTAELLALYGQAPWLRAIVGKIARATAEIGWNLYAKKGEDGRYIAAYELLRKTGKSFDAAMQRSIDLNEMEMIVQHPLLELLRRGTGNPRLNGFGVFQVTQEHLDLTGEAYWLLEKDNLGIPINKWPLPPSWVRSLPTEKAPFYEIFAPGGGRIAIPYTEIIPFVDPSPENPYGRGLSISQTLDDEIQIDEFAAKHQKSFFLNRARPDVIISGQFISKQDAERLEKKWLSDHQGFWKAFKPLFFSQKVDVKEISHTFESMQMVQVRKSERDTFIQVFGCPPEKFGIVNESKRSTIAAADYFWTHDIIKPRVEAIRRVLQQTLVPMFDERLLLWYETPVVQDDDHRLEVMRNAPWTVKINEWRKEMGFASLGNAGEALFMPLNMQVVPLLDENGKPLDTITIEQPNANGGGTTGKVNEGIDTRLLSMDIAREITHALKGSFEKVRTLPKPE